MGVLEKADRMRAEGRSAAEISSYVKSQKRIRERRLSLFKRAVLVGGLMVAGLAAYAGAKNLKEWWVLRPTPITDIPTRRSLEDSPDVTYNRPADPKKAWVVDLNSDLPRFLKSRIEYLKKTWPYMAEQEANAISPDFASRIKVVRMFSDLIEIISETGQRVTLNSQGMIHIARPMVDSAAIPLGPLEAKELGAAYVWSKNGSLKRVWIDTSSDPNRVVVDTGPKTKRLLDVRMPSLTSDSIFDLSEQNDDGLGTIYKSSNKGVVIVYHNILLLMQSDNISAYDLETESYRWTRAIRYFSYLKALNWELAFQHRGGIELVSIRDGYTQSFDLEIRGEDSWDFIGNGVLRYYLRNGHLLVAFNHKYK